MRRAWLIGVVCGCTFNTKIDDIVVDVGTSGGPSTPPVSTTPSPVDTAADTASPQTTPTSAGGGTWIAWANDAASVQVALEPDDVPACDGLPLVAWLELQVATGHGGPVVGTYQAYEGDGLAYDQRTFRASHRVGATGTDLSRLGDVLEITAFDEASGRAEGVADLAEHGIFGFAVDLCP